MKTPHTSPLAVEVYYQTHYNKNNCIPRINSQTMATCKTKKDWCEASLVMALAVVQEKKLSLKAAAAKHGVP